MINVRQVIFCVVALAERLQLPHDFLNALMVHVKHQFSNVQIPMAAKNVNNLLLTFASPKTILLVEKHIVSLTPILGLMQLDIEPVVTNAFTKIQCVMENVQKDLFHVERDVFFNQHLISTTRIVMENVTPNLCNVQIHAHLAQKIGFHVANSDVFKTNGPNTTEAVGTNARVRSTLVNKYVLHKKSHQVKIKFLYGNSLSIIDFRGFKCQNYKWPQHCNVW